MARQSNKAAVIARDSFDAEKTVQPIKAKDKYFDTRKENRIQEIKDLGELAETPVQHMNWQVQEFKEISIESMDWTVWRYYPYAAGGAVMVDYPQTTRQEKVCEKKAVVLAKKNIRYMLYRPEMEDNKLQEMGA